MENVSFESGAKERRNDV